MCERSGDPVAVTLEQSVTPKFTAFSALVDRGKFLVPSMTAVDMTLHLCHIWRQLVGVEDTRQKLMGSYNPRQVFVEAVTAVCTDEDASGEVVCDECHSLSKLKRRMASALFSLFAGNMAGDMNSEVHGKKRQRTNIASRSKASDKRRKLSGGKKA